MEDIVFVGKELEHTFASEKEFLAKHDLAQGLLLLSCTTDPLLYITNISDVSQQYRMLKQLRYTKLDQPASDLVKENRKATLHDR